MKVFSWPERKAVSLGILWGLLSVAELPGGGVGTVLVGLPTQVSARAWSFLGLVSGGESLVYATAIVLAMTVALTAVSIPGFLTSRMLFWRVGNSEARLRSRSRRF